MGLRVVWPSMGYYDGNKQGFLSVTVVEVFIFIEGSFGFDKQPSQPERPFFKYILINEILNINTI